MWYSNSKQQLDLTKPIFAVRKDNPKVVFVLLSHIGQGNYSVNGYDWFNISTGDWNSCRIYKSVSEAIESMGTYNISNGELVAKIVSSSVRSYGTMGG